MDENHVPGADGSTSNSGASARASSHSTGNQGADAGAQLNKEFQELLDKALNLGQKAVEILRSHTALACFLASERMRLFLIRIVLLLLGIAMLSLSWLFLSMFLWRTSVEITGYWAAGPLILLLTHGAMGAVLLVWRERMRIE